MVEYRMFRNKVQRSARNLRYQYYRRHINELRNSNPKQWWKNIKKLTGQTVPNHVIGMANEMCGSNVQQLTNNINVFLQSVSDDLEPLLPELIPSVSHCPDEFIIEPYTVERKLSKINCNKSCGPDNIANWILRDGSVWIAEPVCAIFNASVRDGIVSIIWKKLILFIFLRSTNQEKLNQTLDQYDNIFNFNTSKSVRINSWYLDP